MQRNCETPASSFDMEAAWSVIQVLAYGMDGLFAATQVLISLVNPVGARRIEYIKIDRVLHGFRPVRHVRRDGQHLAGVHHDLFAVNPELQCAFQNIGELLVVMTVQRDDAALLHQDPRHHDVVTHHKLALQQRVQVFQIDRMPGNVFQFHLAGLPRGFLAFRFAAGAPASCAFALPAVLDFRLRLFVTRFAFAFAISVHLSLIYSHRIVVQVAVRQLQSLRLGDFAFGNHLGQGRGQSSTRRLHSQPVTLFRT